MGIVSITYRCGCPGDHKIVCNQPTNRDKEKIRQKERGLCPDCYREKLETEFLERWGRLPSVHARSENQEAFAVRVLMALLSSQRVRAGLMELLMATPNLPVERLLDLYTSEDRRDPPDFFGAISWQENILKHAYPDLWAKFKAALGGSSGSQSMDLGPDGVQGNNHVASSAEKAVGKQQAE